MNGFFNNSVCFLRKSALGLALVFGVGSAATTSEAASIGDFTIGTTEIYSEIDLYVSSDGFSFEATNLSFSTFVSAVLDGSGDLNGSSANDLEIVDDSFNPILNGAARDIAVDTSDDTISILYELGDNTLSSDTFALAVLFFPQLDLTDPFDFAVTDVQVADLDVFGATRDVNVVPLPAGIWLMLGGIGGLLTLRRRTKTAAAA